MHHFEVGLHRPHAHNDLLRVTCKGVLGPDIVLEKVKPMFFGRVRLLMFIWLRCVDEIYKEVAAQKRMLSHPLVLSVTYHLQE